jgi:hypothetical protein
VVLRAAQIAHLISVRNEGDFSGGRTMTKTKTFLSVFGVIAAAGAVVASIMMKNRGKIKVEGELEAKGNRMGMPNKGVHGSATVRATQDRSPQH